MPALRPLAFALLSIATAFALYAAGSRDQISPGSRWTIDSGCEIVAGSDGGAKVVIRPNHAFPGEHEIAVHNPAFTKFTPGETVTVRFGAPDEAVGQHEYSATGYREGGSTFYVANAFDEILDALAATNLFRFYRDDVLVLEQDITGYPEALAAMRACETKGFDDPEKM